MDWPNFRTVNRLKMVAIFQWCYWPKMNLPIVLLCHIQAINLKTFSHWLKSPKNRCQITILRTIYSVYYLPIEKMLRITILHLCLEIWAKSENLSEIKPPLAFQMCMLDKKYPPQFAENIFNRQFSSYQCVFPNVQKLHFLLPVSRNSIKHQF